MAFTNRVADGGEILLSVGNKVVGCATQHSIEMSGDTREISCKGSGQWKSSEYSKKSWTCSIDALYNAYEGDNSTVLRYAEWVDLWNTSTLIDIESTYTEGSDTVTQYGQAVISSISQSAPDADNVSYSISLTGRGELGTTGSNLWEIAVTATGADYVIVEETQRVYPYTAGLTIKAVNGTYNITAYSSSETIDRSSVVINGANGNITLTLA